ncbi:ribulose-phosphate 3-epimerase [Acetanaerobacterium sp. MSJ-12]|uniref:ribulose-phosphate 3-epimerase n=1 Tax=Acetanaerobacterium sp. MSJ-12 TaxID=2841535 RepID=UPI002570BBF0|nr:ribulose-phosphate 3-epimerase [Acetanaerobacterium sp. MSJ-12]
MGILTATLACADWLHLGDDLRALERGGCDWYHLDIMDGHYVPNLCLNFDLIRAVRAASPLPVDCHLMVENPGDYLSQLAQNRVERAAFHLGCPVDTASLLKELRRVGIAPGLALNPDEPVGALSPYLELCDWVLLMGVKPGFSGQSFLPGTVERVARLAALRRTLGRPLLIEVDGGIGPENGCACADAGADALVAGAFAVFSQPDGVEAACRRFRAAAFPGA